MRRWILLIAFLWACHAGHGAGFVRDAVTVTELITFNPAGLHKSVQVNGLASENDGQGGWWKWYDGDITATNTTTVFASLFPTAAPGRWKKLTLGNMAPPDPSGAITNFTVITVPTIPDLQNVTVTEGIQLVTVEGYYNRDDGGGGDFVYKAESTDAADGGIVFAPNDGSGKWHRIIDPLGGVRIPWWGYTTNETIEAAASFSSAHTNAGSVVFPGGLYIIDGTKGITIKSNVRLVGDAGATLVVASNPSTNYQIFDFEAGATNITIANIDFQGWPNAPGGTAANFGRAWTVSGVTNLTWFGCSFTGFWSEAIKMGTNDWSQAYAMDRFGERSSVLAFGADPTGITDSSPAFREAITALGATTGGEIIIPPGVFAVNIVVTNRNVSLVGSSSPAGDSAMANRLVPWNTNAPIIQVGGDFPSPSTASHAQAFKTHNLSLYGVGPNGRGKIGLLLTGGALKGEYYSGTTYDFAEYGVKIGGGTNQETLYNKFYNWHFENCNEGLASVIVGRTNTMAWYNPAYPTSINDMSFFACNFSGAAETTNSACLIIDSAPVDAIGCWFQGRSHAGVIFRKSSTSLPILFNSLSRFEIVEFAGDAGGSVALWNQYDANHLFCAVIRGTFSVNSGTYYMATDGVRIDPTGGCLEDSTMLIEAMQWGSMYYQGAGSSAWTNIQYDVKSARGGNDLQWNNSLGNYTFVTDTDGRGILTSSTNASARVMIRYYDPVSAISHTTHLTQNGTNNFSITPPASSLFYLRSGNGEVAATIQTNAKAQVLSLGSIGVGINRVATSASLEVDGSATLMLGPAISSSKTYTNEAPTTVGPWEVNFNVAPVSADSATVFHAIYARGAVSPAAIFNVTADPGIAPIRSEVAHAGTNTVSNSAGFYTGNPSVTGGGTITSHVGFRGDVAAGTGRYNIRTSTGQNRFNGPLGIKVDPLIAVDVSGAIAMRTVGGVTSLTVDDQTITIGDRSYIKVSSDNGTASIRTFILSAGLVEGQLLDLEWSGTGAAELVDDSAAGSGNHRLNGTWTPTQYDVLVLRWNGTDWIERGRSAN